MGLKDRIITMLGGTPPAPKVEYADGKPIKGIGSLSLPESDPIAQMILQRMAAGGSGPMIFPKDSPEGRALMERFGGGSPAADPVQEAVANLGSDTAGNVLDWSIWDKERKVLVADLPGWSPCRFYHRVGINEACGIFGAVKGDFGIWRMPFNICDYDADETDEPRKVLPSLTHLPTGLDFGLFADVMAAREASEAALMLDWSSMPPASPDEAARHAWATRLMQLRQTWGFNGLHMEERRHAHDPNGDGDTIPIFAKRAVESKPEKLS